jgi:hypothetical protein
VGETFSASEPDTAWHLFKYAFNFADMIAKKQKHSLPCGDARDTAQACA